MGRERRDGLESEAPEMNGPIVDLGFRAEPIMLALRKSQESINTHDRP